MKKSETTIQLSNDEIKISDLAELSGASISTIHHYVKMGVLPPPQKKGLKRAKYRISHLLVLNRIRELRQTSKLPLAKIKQVMEQQNWSDRFTVSDEYDTAVLLNNLEEKKIKTKAIKEAKKRLQIIDAAIILFAKNGYEKTTLEVIAESLRIAKSTVYLYFENKDDLFMGCIDRLTFTAVPQEAWDTIRNEKNFFERLKKRAVAFHRVFPNYKGILNLLKSALTSENTQMAKKAGDALLLMTKPIKDDIRRGIKAGMFRQVDEDILSHLILAMGEGLGFRLLMDSQFSMSEAIEIMFKFMEGGVLKNLSESFDDHSPSDPICGEVTDIKGNMTWVSKICFGEQGKLAVRIGKARVKVDLYKIKQLKVLNIHSTFGVYIKMNDGQNLRAEADRSICLSGHLSCGIYSIPLKMVDMVEFAIK